MYGLTVCLSVRIDMCDPSTNTQERDACLKILEKAAEACKGSADAQATAPATAPTTAPPTAPPTALQTAGSTFITYADMPTNFSQRPKRQAKAGKILRRYVMSEGAEGLNLSRIGLQVKWAIGVF